MNSILAWRDFYDLSCGIVDGPVSKLRAVEVSTETIKAMKLSPLGIFFASFIQKQ